MALAQADHTPASPAQAESVQLQCPLCCTALAPSEADIRCTQCSTIYRRAASGQVDFRLPHVKQLTLTVEVGAEPPTVPPIELGANPSPEVELDELVLPSTISRRFASWLPAAPRSGAVVLDLGCGDTRARGLVERAGYTYVGIDFSTPEATYLADGHALPFADGSFDLVVTTAVIEYFRHPYVAMQEVHRVLRPGGRFCGNVSFLTPYLPVTYFHHTHMGILSTLQNAGFTVDRLLLDRRWTAIESTTRMAYFTRLPERLRQLFTVPFMAAHRLWWAIGDRFVTRPLSETERLLRVTADVEFLARRH
jgi:SAM-dependent methyltransferase